MNLLCWVIVNCQERLASAGKSNIKVTIEIIKTYSISGMSEFSPPRATIPVYHKLGVHAGLAPACRILRIGGILPISRKVRTDS